VQSILLSNAFGIEVQANGGAADTCSGGPGASFMPKLGASRYGMAIAPGLEGRDVKRTVMTRHPCKGRSTRCRCGT
jgi:hypothetical protein